MDIKQTKFHQIREELRWSSYYPQRYRGDILIYKSCLFLFDIYVGYYVPAKCDWNRDFKNPKATLIKKQSLVINNVKDGQKLEKILGDQYIIEVVLE